MFYSQYSTYYYMTFSILHYTLIAGQKLIYLKAVLLTELNIQFSKLICKKERIINKKTFWINVSKYFYLIKSFGKSFFFFLIGITVSNEDK